MLDERLIVLVVEEVLLELVEDEVEVSSRLRSRPRQCLDERPTATCRFDQSIDGRACPRPEYEHPDSGLSSQPVGDSRAEHGGLADPGRTEQNGEARRHEVRGDHLAVAVATEENSASTAEASNDASPL